jgi:hypothetical protein
MTSKTTIGLLTAGLAFVALAPLAGAAVNDDTLSRSFVYVSGARAEMDGDGTGWLDASNPPNVCVASLRGVQTPIIGVFYYETLRVYTNLPGFVEPTTVPATATFVPLACPAVLNPLCTAITSCGIYIQPTTVGAFARTIIPQDGLVCTQQSSFISCVVTASKWTIAACPWASATFTSGLVNKGFFAGTGLETLLMSQDINCAGYGPAYDVSFLLGSGGDLLSSGFEGVPASLLVPFGNGADDTGFVVQCLQATYTTVDTSTPIPTITPGIVEDGVDWEQILDLDDAFSAFPGTNWVGDLSKQVGSGGATTIALAGLYNLGGANGCDFTANTTLPECFDDLNNDPWQDNDVDSRDKTPTHAFTGEHGCWFKACDPIAAFVCVDYYRPWDNDEWF